MILRPLKTASTKVVGRFLIIFLISLGVLACEQRKDLLNKEVYEGPLMDMDSVVTMMSDSGKIVIQLSALSQQDFENGDRVWPKGLSLEYYNNKGQKSTTFRSNYVIKSGEDNTYKGEGNVIVRNLINGDELNTEELYWDPKKEIFYTDKFVTIQSDGEIHTGEGLEANQDFTTYKILKPSGSLLLEDDF